MGILLSNQRILLRPIILKNKPQDMLTASPKGTVPVLILNESQVIDESLDIMIWALTQSDPNNLLRSIQPENLTLMLDFLSNHDQQFTQHLSLYKQAKRYHKASLDSDREQCEVFINTLEQRLNQHSFIMGSHPSIVDYAILPFVRQFSKVERQWFLQAPYPKLQQWLNNHIQSTVFSKSMVKYPLWLETKKDILFPKK